MSDAVSRLVKVTKTFGDGPGLVKAVSEASLVVGGGESVGIVGPSGSGKTTLLNLMGGLLTPSEGAAFLLGEDLGSVTPDQRRVLRLSKVGFVFQQLKLIPTLSAMENVELPLVLSNAQSDVRNKRAKDLIEAVGLSGKERRRPGQLSVGEQQRVAVARALVNRPALILADEPTSQLDSQSGRQIVDLLESLREAQGSAVVVSTHDTELVKRFGSVYQVRDGVVSQ